MTELCLPLLHKQQVRGGTSTVGLGAGAAGRYTAEMPGGAGHWKPYLALLNTYKGILTKPSAGSACEGVCFPQQHPLPSI